MSDNATVIANLKTRRLNISTQLAAIGVGENGYYPTSTGPGANADHDGHALRLHKELEMLKKQITELEIEDAMNAGNLGESFTQMF